MLSSYKHKTTITAESILAIQETNPEKLFEVNTFEDESRRLMSVWHPDRNPDPKADTVFAHLRKLIEAAKTKIDTNSWNGAATFTFHDKKGKSYNFHYKKLLEFELGKMYIGLTKVLYVIDNNYKISFDSGIRMIKGIKYPSSKFKKEFEKYMPNVVNTFDTTIGQILLSDKTDDLILLKDLLDYLPDRKIDPKHVAWIVNSLYNIAAFLEHQEICHNSITPMTYFLSPKHHSGVLLGGWQYSKKAGDRIHMIPSYLAHVYPKEVYKNKTAKTKYDRLAIKALAIECLGDRTLSGAGLLMDKSIPKSMVNWLRQPSTLSAIDEYKEWMVTVKQCFGERKFIKLDIDINEIY